MGIDSKSMMELDAKLNKDFEELVKTCTESGKINLDLYTEYDVKRGLRDSNGNGVLTGLTEISDVTGTIVEEGVKVPAPGCLYYQGYNVIDMLRGNEGKKYAFEEAIYLLLFGKLPTQKQLEQFVEILSNFEEISGAFLRDVIMKAPSGNIMNALQKSVLTLYSYDENPDDTSMENVLRQSLQLICKVPLISVYAYYSYRHFQFDESLLIRTPDKSLSIAENLLRMIHPDGHYTELEARVLDIALVIHAEHGGGNNSTFTNHVVTSSGTDTYSAVAASIASLKGPRHGGANLKVQQMFDDLKQHCPDWTDAKAISEYLIKILDREAFDKAGLIYGMGHAVYTESDPRQVILKDYAGRLAKEKGRMDEFNLYVTVENIAGELIAKRRRLFRPICANVDFYSGFVYNMLGVPMELYTPLFAISRMAGWSAHRLEEICNNGKIIRPAYKFVGTHKPYCKMEDRKEQ